MKCSEYPAVKQALLRRRNKIEVPEFKSYEEEATFWDNLDTGDFMEDDGEWFHFDVADACTVRVGFDRPPLWS